MPAERHGQDRAPSVDDRVRKGLVHTLCKCHWKRSLTLTRTSVGRRLVFATAAYANRPEAELSH
jgi:hypothetical protein